MLPHYFYNDISIRKLLLLLTMSVSVYIQNNKNKIQPFISKHLLTCTSWGIGYHKVHKISKTITFSLCNFASNFSHKTHRNRIFFLGSSSCLLCLICVITAINFFKGKILTSGVLYLFIYLYFFFLSYNFNFKLLCHIMILIARCTI